ncbi:MAG: c-type cytochrome [Terriglobia bacterium]
MRADHGRGGNFAGGTPEQEGNSLYMQRCQTRHGPDRNGVANPKEIGTERFKTIIAKGQGGQMPAFTDLTPPRLGALAAYISNPAAGALPPGRGGGGGRGNAGALSGGGGTTDRMSWPEGLPRYFGGYGGRIVGTADSLPAMAPPWTTLTAYDLNEGTIKWQIPLGTVPFLAARGIRNTGGRQYLAFLATGQTAGRAPGAGVSWKAGKAEAQGYYVFALPQSGSSPAQERL